ncbi:hypothetical protein BGW39_005114 [Mortierella sp. 14UC]|nr:hypothetical protein BGW39_005114 [Mortierella sp. 14UC]
MDNDNTGNLAAFEDTPSGLHGTARLQVAHDLGIEHRDDNHSSDSENDEVTGTDKASGGMNCEEEYDMGGDDESGGIKDEDRLESNHAGASENDDDESNNEDDDPLDHNSQTSSDDEDVWTSNLSKRFKDDGYSDEIGQETFDDSDSEYNDLENTQQCQEHIGSIDTRQDAGSIGAHQDITPEDTGY